ncbi:c-type cytochrome biogenesis protein CcmI [Nereida sp. MMG025]|uniref:c-type cytochrome biogenesis protein CcmI n=1 Tax=Nereida sp. MMG025 TaxID=2909981 RepID=UPI00351CF4B3|nr:c-type cytochrome biogenesis protein CcmI [Nereida sp. MMG025]
MFWFITIALTLVVTFWIVSVMIKRASAEVDAPEAFDVEVYRAQLAEVDRDLERGIVTPDEAEAIRTEVSRRLLAADAKAQNATVAQDAPKGLTQTTAVVGALAVIGGAMGLYYWQGAPGYGDLPHNVRVEAADTLRQERPSQAEAVAEVQMRGALPVDVPEGFETLVAELRAAVAERQDDAQGLGLLAGAEARLGNYAAATDAQRRLIGLKGADATATDHITLVDFMVLDAGGYVSPEAEREIGVALQLDPRNGPARYYMGRMFAQTGRPDLSFGIWRELLDTSLPGDPWVAPIRDEIEMMAARAGASYELPPLPSGPSDEAIAAARDMSPQERMEMIQGMVEGLNERLATEGGTPADWARLIGAYGVLGETQAAAAIWENAQTSFADAPEALSVIREAAVRAGVAQ